MTAATVMSEAGRREALTDLARNWNRYGETVRSLRLLDLLDEEVLKDPRLPDFWDTFLGELALLDGINGEPWAAEVPLGRREPGTDLPGPHRGRQGRDDHAGRRGAGPADKGDTMTVLADAPAQPGAEVTLHCGSVMTEYRPRIVMAPEEAKELDDALRAMMKAVLREGVDYGVIPGTGTKPTLLKPGAEKLLQWFGFGHTVEVTETERDPDGRWAGVTYRCTVTKAMPDGSTVTAAMCEGYAGYDEDRFFLTATDARRKAEEKERANANRYQRNVNPAKWETITSDYRAPRNSVVKMCQKRALVGAALQATSASTLFTQDVEDLPGTPDTTVATAAKAVILGLPDDVRDALDQWYRAQRWGNPDSWDADQWCAALVQAGKLSAIAPAPQPAPDAAPATPAPPAPRPSAEWLDEALAQAVCFADVDAGQKLWGEAVEKRKAHQITTAECERIKELIKARWKELDDAKGAPLSPDDPWAPKVEEITCEADALAVNAEIEDALKAGEMDTARADADPGGHRTPRL